MYTKRQAEKEELFLSFFALLLKNSGTFEEDVADNQPKTKRVSGNFYFLLLSIQVVMTILVKRMHVLSALKV